MTLPAWTPSWDPLLCRASRPRAPVRQRHVAPRVKLPSSTPPHAPRELTERTRGPQGSGGPSPPEASAPGTRSRRLGPVHGTRRPAERRSRTPVPAAVARGWPSPSLRLSAEEGLRVSSMNPYRAGLTASSPPPRAILLVFFKLKK